VRISVETAGGGGVVVLIGLLLLWSHGGGGGVSTALVVLVVVLIVAVMAGLTAAGCLLYRAMQRERAAASPVPPRVLRAEVLPPSLSPEDMRQLAELAALLRGLNAGAGPDPAAVAEILRRGQRPEWQQERKRSWESWRR